MSLPLTVSEKVTTLLISPHPIRFTAIILTHEATAVITELVIFAECYVIIKRWFVTHARTPFLPCIQQR
jgi:hypothetical protein